MFGFFRRRRLVAEARTKIGIELHRQLKEALHADERVTEKNLSTVFVVGYLYWFVRMGFTHLGIDGGSVVDKQLRPICDGVLPNKLYEIFERQMAALKIAQGMNDQTAQIRGANVTPAQLTELFEKGSKVGAFDGSYVEAKPSNLKAYLLGQDIDIQKITKKLDF